MSAMLNLVKRNTTPDMATRSSGNQPFRTTPLRDYAPKPERRSVRREPPIPTSTCYAWFIISLVVAGLVVVDVLS